MRRPPDQQRAPARLLAAAVAVLLVTAGCSASRQSAPSAVPSPTSSPGGSAVVDDTSSASPPSTTRPRRDDAGTIAPLVAPTTVPPSTAAASPDPVAGATGDTVFGEGRGAVALAPITDAQWAAVDAYLGERLITGGDFAWSVAVNVDGVPVHAGAGGVRNHPDIVPDQPDEPAETPPLDPNATPATTTTTTTIPGPPPEPVDTSMRFRIASISKMITGTVVLQLVNQGLLTLDDPVGDRLGAFLGVDVSGRPGQQITVRQLLSHTSGFGAYENTFFRRGVESCRDAAIRGMTEGLQNDPGTTYRYSNMNFCLLEQLIEAVTGRPYQDVANEYLLAPLGLSGMRLAGTFDVQDDEVRHPSFPGRNYMEVLGGAGSWTATPSQLVTIVDSLDNTKPGFHPLPPDLSRLMREAIPGIEYNDPTTRWYGLATIVFADQSWGHTGTVENTHAMVLHRPDGMTWALLVSGNFPENSGDLAEIFQAALDNAGINAPAPTTSTTTTTTTTIAPVIEESTTVAVAPEDPSTTTAA